MASAGPKAKTSAHSEHGDGHAFQGFELGQMMRIAGVVTEDPSHLANFKEVAVRAGAKVDARSFPSFSVGFATFLGPGVGFADEPSGSMVSVAYTPPLAEGDGTQKAAATLTSCSSAGNPIENEGDQCSVAFWNPRDASLLLYRDWRGSPPLFYSLSSSTMWWSTSIKGLLALGAARDVDCVALAQLQKVGYVPAPRTMVDSIRKIPAGHVLSFHNGAARVRRHWQPQWGPKHRDGVSKRAHRIRDILTRSTTRMAAQDGPTGILLSGGIDSIVVAAVAKRSSELDLRAFTFRYEEYSGIYNEAPLARAVAKYLDVEHHEIAIGPSYIMEGLPRLVTEYEEPMTYGLHSALMQAIADAGIDTVLSGVDAPGFNLSRVDSLGFDLDALVPKKGIDLVQRLTPDTNSGPFHRMNTLLDVATSNTEERYLHHPLHIVVAPQTAAHLYADRSLLERANADLIAGLSRTLDEGGELTPRDQIALLGLNGSGPEHMLTWNHRWGDAAGVTSRYPLYDAEFVTYMGRRHKRSSDKADLRGLAAMYLPDEMTQTPKVSQAIPLDSWLRGPMKDYMRSHLTKADLDQEGSFNTGVLLTQLDEHIDGRANHKWVLWTCLAYLIWRDRVLGV